MFVSKLKGIELSVCSKKRSLVAKKPVIPILWHADQIELRDAAALVRGKALKVRFKTIKWKDKRAV